MGTDKDQVIIFSTPLNPRGYYVAVFAGNNPKDVAAILTNSSNRKIVFESTTKLLPEKVEEIRNVFRTSGVTLDEFWVPSSVRQPGVVDLNKLTNR